MSTLSNVVRALLAENNVWLAPLSGVGDSVFRGLCLRFGAGLTYTEMISAKGLHYDNERTADLLVLASNETRAAVQLFGADPAILAYQAQKIADDWGDRLALIDINMGCPVIKVTKKGEGSALMKDPELASKIIRTVRDAIDVPLTVKFRSGWEEGTNTAPDFARMAEASGASAICVHGRSATQLYSGSCDWSVIAAVKEAVTIPVLGSGDLFSQEDIAAAFARSGVDGVMVARGARGNPWIFSGHTPSHVERIEMALLHAKGLCEIDGNNGIARMRKHVAWYISSVPHAAALRSATMECSTYDQLEELLTSVKLELEKRDDGCA
ncbi:MAG: tRNA dihydrouridine synthase DusB [Actinobacteria bacterium]|nr:tRNA dihydrouridine synthase DusB [Actinomycetota bacterium]